jgi:uncharacterized protein YciI
MMRSSILTRFSLNFRTLSRHYAATPASFDAAANKTYLLEYEYVENMGEKRTPHRQRHLDYTKPYVDNKNLVAGGALVPAIDKGFLIFRGFNDIHDVEKFARHDPYVQSGLVKKWKVSEWAIVVGDEYMMRKT